MSIFGAALTPVKRKCFHQLWREGSVHGGGGEVIQCARAATCQPEFAQCTFLLPSV